MLDHIWPATAGIDDKPVSERGRTPTRAATEPALPREGRRRPRTAAEVDPRPPRPAVRAR